MHDAARPLLAAACLALAGCASTPFDPTVEGRALLQRDAQWAQVAAEGKDVDRMLSYFGDDAIMIPPGQPIVEGKAAIRRFVESSLRIPGFGIRWQSDDVRFSPDGKLAYMRGVNATTVPGPGGTLVTVPGRGITVWRKDTDGQWRCVVDIWNDPPRAPAGK